MFFKKKKTIKFHSLIGSILKSLLDAQDASFEHIVTHINRLLDKDKKTPIYFTYKKNEKEFKIPLINILPFPHLDISEAVIDLNLNLEEHTISKMDDSLKKLGIFSREKFEIDTSYNNVKQNDQLVKVRIVFKNHESGNTLQAYIDSMMD